MSDLRPKGISVMIGGVEREILFTLAAVDEIQAYYDAPVSEVISQMADEEKVVDISFRIMFILINDKIARDRYFNGSTEELLTEQELKWLMTLNDVKNYVGAILTAYGLSLPEEDEDEDPNAESRSS